MSEQTITIAEIKPTPSGKKVRIRSTTDQWFSDWLDKGHALQVGQTYKIDPVNKPWQGKNGMMDDFVIQKATLIAQATTAAPATNGHAAPVRNDHPSGPMGMVNAFISIGAIAADEEAIALLIKKCRNGHRKGWAD